MSVTGDSGTAPVPAQPEKIESVVKVVPPVKIDPVTPKVVTPEVKPEATGERTIIRIKAGSDKNWKDKDGNEWLADAGFTDGAMVNLGSVKIENTGNSDLYASEHIGMEKFFWPVPNGKYAVKLHFAENPEDVKKAGERVFSVDVMGAKIVNLDIFKDAGGTNKALVKTIKVNVTGGKIEITFKAEHKETLVNGIEIIPE